MEYNVNLVRSTYNSLEAEEILMELIGHKINFLNQKLFGENIRGKGENTVHYKRRIQELKEEKKTIGILLKSLYGKGIQFKMACNIEIQVIDPREGREQDALVTNEQLKQ
ncbi:hypothetical protein [Luteibaculum oceani]|uniref:Uncharacterized protein n=1 Tax=Luteibaculum oceani TaxID=1294296 RepID=A0A5C6UZ42_9FLAO|nr:hypothetical protein [Luteibaculum oceani]TXC78692.1 hypothetical protein FRX97_08210 [Luteibaculum oceani]